MVKDLVSTIIPVYNRPVLLGEAVASVLTQTWRPIEIIIVDDGSTDYTPAVAAEIADRHPEIVRVLRQDNAGPGVARQLGLEDSRGEFVQFLDSDDLLLPEKFSMQVEGLRQDADAGISYGLTLALNIRTGERRPTHGTDIAHREIFPAVLAARLWATLTPLYRRSVCAAIGPWSKRRILEDWNYDCRAGLLGVRLHYCAAPVALQRQGLEDHAGRMWEKDCQAMRDRIAAYAEVLEYAKKAGVSRAVPEMQKFVRSLFWMARNAGSYGLPDEARRLFDLARAEALHPGWDYRLLGWAAAWFGWERTSRWADRLTRRAS